MVEETHELRVERSAVKHSLLNMAWSYTSERTAALVICIDLNKIKSVVRSGSTPEGNTNWGQWGGKRWVRLRAGVEI